MPKEPTEIYKRFWENLAKYLENNNSRLRMDKKKYERPNYDILIVAGGAYIALTTSKELKKHSVEILLRASNNKERFYNGLSRQKDAINKQFGLPLQWHEKGRKQNSDLKSSIVHEKDFDPMDEADWQRQFAWFKETIEKFDKVFTRRLEII